MDLGSREEEMILSPVSRCGVRREEEIGARLSNECYMNSTELIDNTMGDMPAMQIRAGWKKNVAPLEGRAEPQSCRNEFPQGGNAGCAREEETHRCDEWAYRPRASAQQPGR